MSKITAKSNKLQNNLLWTKYAFLESGSKLRLLYFTGIYSAPPQDYTGDYYGNGYGYGFRYPPVYPCNDGHGCCCVDKPVVTVPRGRIEKVHFDNCTSINTYSLFLLSMGM